MCGLPPATPGPYTGSRFRADAGVPGKRAGQGAAARLTLYHPLAQGDGLLEQEPVFQVPEAAAGVLVILHQAELLRGQGFLQGLPGEILAIVSAAVVYEVQAHVQKQMI